MLALLCGINFLNLPFIVVAGEMKDVNGMTSPNKIEIKDFAFYPQTLTVKSGEKVTWINRDEEPHTVVSVEKRFKKSTALDTDQEFTITAGAPGTYTYFCSVHPKMTFPIALFIASVVFEVLAGWRKQPLLASVAYYNLVGAALTIPLALATGLGAWRWQLGRRYPEGELAATSHLRSHLRGADLPSLLDAIAPPVQEHDAGGGLHSRDIVRVNDDHPHWSFGWNPQRRRDALNLGGNVQVPQMTVNCGRFSMPRMLRTASPICKTMSAQA